MGSKTTRQRTETLTEVAREVGVYPESAYHFVRDGLEFASRSIHGAMTPPQLTVAEYLSNEGIDLIEAKERMESGTLDATVAAAVRQAGGFDRLNRNVSGEDLCWCLREFALKQWGMLAELVLSRWRITTTEDFGRLIFALVEHGFMQKEPGDSIDHFKSVYDFREAFSRSYRIADEMG